MGSEQPAGSVPIREICALTDSNAHKMLEVLIDGEKKSISELSELLDMAKNFVSFHARRFEDLRLTKSGMLPDGGHKSFSRKIWLTDYAKKIVDNYNLLEPYT